MNEKRQNKQVEEKRKKEEISRPRGSEQNMQVNKQGRGK